MGAGHAELAGRIDRGSEPYVAMLAARCVQPGTGQGARQPRPSVDKVSSREFAMRSQMSTSTVTAYLNTWDAMAAAGIVPDRADLAPGMDVAELPTGDEWDEHYRAAKPRKEATSKSATSKSVTSKPSTKLRVPNDGSAFTIKRAQDHSATMQGPIGELYRRVIDTALALNSPESRDLLDAVAELMGSAFPVADDATGNGPTVESAELFPVNSTALPVDDDNGSDPGAA